MTQARASLRDLPSVDRLLSHVRAAAWMTTVDREYVARLCREILADLRRQIAEGASLPLAELDEHNILTRVERRMSLDRHSGLVRIVNATGTILHTNFGRAQLPEPAIDAMVLAARHPVNLEYDLDSGGRGDRDGLVGLHLPRHELEEVPPLLAGKPAIERDDLTRDGDARGLAAH